MEGKNPKEIIKEVEEEFALPEGSIVGRKRSHYVIKARREAIKKMRAEGMSYPDIGGYLKRHYSSVMSLMKGDKSGDNSVDNPVEKQGKN